MSTKGNANTNMDESLVGTRYKEWILTSELGFGGFGSVYKAQNTEEPTVYQAIKVFKKADDAYAEINAIQKLGDINGVVKMLDSDSTDFGYVMTMDLFGISLSTFRSLQPDKKFSPATSLRLLIKMTQIITQVHSVGLIHCDIKPSNFVMKGNDEIVLIDFGLAESYMDLYGNKNVIKRDQSFKGTLCYAALNIHFGKSPSRADDITSAFFIYFENLLGTLPWSGLDESNTIKQKKIAFAKTEIYDYTQIKLQVISSFHSVLGLLNGEEPRYKMITSQLTELLINDGNKVSPLFDVDEVKYLPQEDNPNDYKTTPISKLGSSSKKIVVTPRQSPTNEEMKEQLIPRIWKAVSMFNPTRISLPFL
ncbi:casein kinase I, putative [Entamoeba invadens IP1]|uniref:non-specific serine/threonine protein kinase n=1 Tax=Entamoeba invadens IP1 TaxID=370355 RepID=A0A0A1U893_ENTIV|nr:casein kinase I, putative [Entamoeba invadens IP1]ELP88198.1 casein kinase I, putative [Entamoeba invadens IP1]|eukprot:XP_004254969.1 casein kinase I, putative [Entamoeba invadens IP1]